MFDENNIDRATMFFIRVESLAACGALKLASKLSDTVDDRP
jgi:hypothetical protein